MNRWWLVLALLVLALAGPAAVESNPCPSSSRPCDERGVPVGGVLPTAGPLSGPPAANAPLSVPPLDDRAPSLVGALLRLLGAVLILALLVVAIGLGYRRFVHCAGARRGMLAWATGWTDEPAADAIRVASRRYLGGRESVAVIHAGGERFLVGITGTHISLLARLETPAVEPAADFTDVLAREATPRGDDASAERTLRTAVERSRARLGRLTHLAVVPRAPRD